jgi:hypothetical protein
VSVLLGLDVLRYRSSRNRFLAEPRYVQSMLEQFSMADCKPRVTPLATGLQLSNHGDLLDAETPYNALIGSLLYLATSTRPDIAHAVSMLSRFISSPRVEHWAASKSVLRYLSETKSLGLLYGDRTEGLFAVLTLITQVM